MLCKQYTRRYGRQTLLLHRFASQSNHHQHERTNSTSNDEPRRHSSRQRYTLPSNNFFRHIRMAMNNGSSEINSQSSFQDCDWTSIQKENSNNNTNTFSQNHFNNQQSNGRPEPSSTFDSQKSPPTSESTSSRTSPGFGTGNSNGTNRKSNLWTSTLSKSINWFYNQSAIDIAATKVSTDVIDTIFNSLISSFQPSVRLTPATILYSGKSADGSHTLVS